MILDTKISELPELNVSLIDETTFIPVVIGIDPIVNRSINVKEFIENIVIQGQTGLTETDPIYEAEKEFLALKTDLNAYALTGHTHTNYVEKEVGKSLISNSQINKLVSYPTIESGNTTEFVRADGQLAPVDLSALLTKEEASNTYSPTGHSHSQYLTNETDPVFSASVAANITTGDISYWNSKQEELISGENIKTINDQSILGSGNLTLTGITFVEQDPIYEAEKHLYSLTGHTHDDRYYTENEINNLLLNKSNTGHTHSQYLTGYTETEPAFNASIAKNITTGDTANWNSKQEELVSGENIKTINEQSILGSGNLTLTGITFVEQDPIYESEKHLYSLTGHSHDDRYYTENEINNLLLNKSNTGHTHSQYLTGETDPVYEADKPSIALKTDLNGYSVTGHTHGQYLTGETDPVYESEKDTLALKTDLYNYSLTGHTHNQYLTGFTELDPVYEAEKHLYSLTGHTHGQYLTGETDPVYLSEKSTLALKTDLSNYYPTSGGTVTGQINAQGGVQITGGASGAGAIYKNAVSGLLMRGIAGSSYDYELMNSGGATVMTIANGGDAAKFWSPLTAASFVKVGGLSTEFLMADGSVSTGGGTGSASLWTVVTGTRASNTSFTIATDVTSYIGKGLIFQWKESGVIKCAMVNSSSYSSPNTTVNIVGDIMASIDTDTLKYCMLPMETVRFAIAGAIGNTGTNMANAFYANQAYRVIGGDLQVGTAGTGDSLVIDINKAGTTMFTNKLGLNTEAFNSNTFKADNQTSLALGDKVSIDIDAVHTTPAVDLYVQLYLFPTRILYQN